MISNSLSSSSVRTSAVAKAVRMVCADAPHDSQSSARDANARVHLLAEILERFMHLGLAPPHAPNMQQPQRCSLLASNEGAAHIALIDTGPRSVITTHLVRCTASARCLRAHVV